MIIDTLAGQGQGRKIGGKNPTEIEEIRIRRNGCRTCGPGLLPSRTESHIVFQDQIISIAALLFLL
jgi:hypothetical protein